MISSFKTASPSITFTVTKLTFAVSLEALKYNLSTSGALDSSQYYLLKGYSIMTELSIS